MFHTGFMSLPFQSLILKSLTVMLFFSSVHLTDSCSCAGGCVYQSYRMVCGKYQLGRLFLPSQSTNPNVTIAIYIQRVSDSKRNGDI